MTRDQAIALIRNSSLSEHADYLVSQLRPSARIHLHEQALPGASLPTSFFGGQPMEPKGFEWPLWDRHDRLQASIERWEKRINPAPEYAWMRQSLDQWKQQLNDGPMPLAFLGQLSLSELSDCIALPDWPASGSLAFFYGDCAVPGDGSGNPGHCRVIYVPEGAALLAAEFPPALKEEHRYPKLHATFHSEWSLPIEPLGAPIDTPFWRNKEYRNLLGVLMSWNSPAGQQPHRCAGYPQQIQGPMEAECQLIAENVEWSRYQGFSVEEGARLRERASDWQLLVQFASDERLNWLWSDVGLIYFWMRRQDIAERKFDHVFAILQSA